MAEREHEKTSGIKSWSHEDRPREKLLSKGKEALTNAELFAILLGSGTTKLSAVDVAKMVLNENNNSINAVSKLTVKELCKFPGIGEAKAITLVAAAELGRRRKADILANEPILSSKQAYEYVYPFLADLDHERFYIILLNNGSRPLKTIQISSGGVSATVVDPKIVFRKALEVSAATAIILAHNHPSGSLNPSSHDLRLTQRLVEAGKLFEITIHDHIIVGHQAYYSFSDSGIMPK
ncbi:DNA repair protein RadC [bacterium]|nr:DNA repair protein RadC [bacterium]